jgi:hypothetical protein
MSYASKRVRVKKSMFDTVITVKDCVKITELLEICTLALFSLT